MIWGTQTRNVVLIDSLSNSGFMDHDSVSLLFTSPAMRIDNVDALRSSLTLSTDCDVATLLKAAWREWGTEMAMHLKGAFSFLICDTASQTYYAARDIFGLCPFYYALHSDSLIVAESSRLVRALIPDPLPPDQLMLADFVAGTVIETEHTFFTGISRLPPAHWMSISAKGQAIQRYWSISDLPRDVEAADLGEQFRDRFDAALSKVFVSNQTALTLSGGLDSSAIAVSLHAQGISGQDVPTLSMTYPETQGWNDGPHLTSIAQHCGLDITEMPSDSHDPLANMEHWLRVMDGPFVARGHSVSFELMSKARGMGATHILSGHGGDEIVSLGVGRLNELARNGRWVTLWRELAGAQKIYGGSRLRLFRNYLSHIPWIRKIERRLARRKQVDRNQVVGRHNLSEALTKEIDPGRYTSPTPKSRPDHDERMLYEAAVTHPIQALSLEVFDLCTRDLGLQICLPFYDQDMMELSASAPSHWKLRKGLTRYLLREAMKKRMPDRVRLRQDKFDFSDNFRRGLLKTPERLLELTDPETSDITNYVNLERVQAIRAKVLAGEKNIANVDAFFLWRVAILGLWLAICNDKPEKPDLIPIGDTRLRS